MSLFSFFRTLIKKRHREPEKVSCCIFGLGNPGEEYQKNRHNIGFRVIDFINSSLTDTYFLQTDSATTTIGTTGSGLRVATVKPLTFMNRSGIAVAEVLRKVSHSETKAVIVVDDFNIPLGSIRLRKDGTHGGHNGLKSIIQTIGTDFPRLRIGIGPLPKGVPIIDFVLGDFLPDEEDMLSTLFPAINDTLSLFMTERIDAVMSKYNKHPALLQRSRA